MQRLADIECTIDCVCTQMLKENVIQGFVVRSFGAFQKGLFEDIAEGMKNAKIVVAFVSDQVNCFTIHACRNCSLLLRGRSIGKATLASLLGTILMLHRTNAGMGVSLTGILGFRVAHKQRILHLGVVYKFDFAKFRCQMAQFHGQ